MKNRFSVLLVILLISIQNINYAQVDNMLEKILQSNSENLSPVLSNPDKFELQIIFTKVTKNGTDKPILETYSFNEKLKEYFYPASTVKFPVAIAALEKLNDLNIEGLNKFSHLSIDSLYEGHISLSKEFKDKCGSPNIANFIKQIFLVSDNESFNRLFDFLGQKEINDRLIKRGFDKTKIVHRLSVSRTATQNMETNPFKFYDDNGEIIYQQPGKVDSANVNPDLTKTKKGVGFYLDGKLINEPKDFSKSNFFGLRDQHNLLIRIMYPQLFEEKKRFNLTEEDYKFLRKYMSMLPKDSECPKYSTKDHWDSIVKFLMFGDTKKSMPKNIKIFNKVGLAYGYLTDNAYIVDKENNVEFFLSATLHVNKNQIYNDDNYEYDNIGLPFLAKLGKIIYDYEIENK